MPLPS